MIVKIYAMLWIALAFITAILYFAGSLTLEIGIVFGFIAFGMVFMGMIGVLPTLASHPTPAKPATARIKATPTRQPYPLGASRRSAHA